MRSKGEIDEANGRDRAAPVPKRQRKKGEQRMMEEAKVKETKE